MNTITRSAALPPGLLALALALAGCGPPGAGASAPAPPSLFDERAVATPSDPVLATGQRVYRTDCYNCHDTGKKGAPPVGSRSAWSPRLTQGLDTLVRHATAGFSGPTGAEMPARGGNDALTDPEIAAAVRYLVSHVN